MRSMTRQLLSRVAVATPDRIFELEAALRRGIPAEEVVARTGIDPWFIRQIERITAERRRIAVAGALDRAGYLRAEATGLLGRAVGLPAPQRRGNGP